MRVKGGSGGGAGGAGGLPSPYVKWERVRVSLSTRLFFPRAREGGRSTPRPASRRTSNPNRSTHRSTRSFRSRLPRAAPADATHPRKRHRLSKLQERCAKIDKAKLDKIKASVDAKSPPRFKHMVVNAKKLQLEEDRLVEIEHQNRKLLDNLSRISERPSGLSGDNGASNGSTARPKALLRGQAPVKRRVTSLNVRKRQEELDRIERENALILRRIRDQNTKESEFSVKKMQSEWKETLEHRKRASQWIG